MWYIQAYICMLLVLRFAFLKIQKSDFLRFLAVFHTFYFSHYAADSWCATGLRTVPIPSAHILGQSCPEKSQFVEHIGRIYLIDFAGGGCCSCFATASLLCCVLLSLFSLALLPQQNTSIIIITRSQSVARITDRTASHQLWGSRDVIGHVII